MIQPNSIQAIARRGRPLHEPLVLAEQLLWDLLRDRRLGGYRFRRRQPIGPFIVDFFCHQIGLVIQLTGPYQEYRQFADQLQEDWLTSHGYTMLRFEYRQIEADPATAGLKILHACQHRKKS